MYLVFGLICQFSSFWAGSKWLYSLPGYDYFPIFELPILGYLVLPFLAMDLYLLYCVAKIAFQRGWIRGRARKILVGLVIFIFVEGVIWGIDEITVITYRMIF